MPMNNSKHVNMNSSDSAGGIKIAVRNDLMPQGGMPPQTTAGQLPPTATTTASNSTAVVSSAPTSAGDVPPPARDSGGHRSSAMPVTESLPLPESIGSLLGNTF